MSNSWFWQSRSVFIVFTLTLVIMSPNESSAAKIVYLIRHAESEENRRIASLTGIFRGLTKFSLPSKADIFTSMELLNVPAQVDSNVSEIGAKQIAHMGETLKDANFLSTYGIQLVAHSPLLRAQETSEGMLGCRAPDMKADSVDRVVELDLIVEKTPQEWTPMYSSTFKKRIEKFEQWLSEQPEETVAIVGHSQYFKAMLGLDFKFGNCDVWQVSFDPSKLACESALPEAVIEVESNVVSNESPGKPTWNLPPQWKDLKVLYACDVEASKKI